MSFRRFRGLPGFFVLWLGQAFSLLGGSIALQGRVFAVRRLIAMGVIPLANLAAGPLADKLLEPAMKPDGALAPWFGPVFGTGPGAGIKVLFFFCGIALTILGPLAWSLKMVREAEERLPDPV